MVVEADAVNGCFDSRVEQFRHQNEHDNRNEQTDLEPRLTQPKSSGDHDAGQQRFFQKRGL